MMISEPDRVDAPVWGYDDVLAFLGLALPTLFLGGATARLIARVLPISKPFTIMLAQLLWYLLLFGALFLLIQLRYRRPAWAALGFRYPFRGAVLALLCGPVLAIAVGLVGYVIHTPQIKMPMFDQMRIDPATTVLFAFFVVVLGPLCEEIAFRGFLMPLVMRTFGIAAGILITAALFGCLHGFEYEWSWRHVLLISVVGGVLGWVRVAARSTLASTFMHATFNLTQLAAFLSQPQ